MAFPTLDFEIELLKTHSTIISLDEVGRGAIAGPVTVAASVFDSSCATEFPKGLRDSKLVPESKRDSLALATNEWLLVETGSVEAHEIDEIGISAALRKAAIIAIEKLAPKTSFLVLLDGTHNWLGDQYQVLTKTKADRDCASVSAASIVAKVWRDGEMRALAESYPEFGLESNKGYASEGHISALREHGPSPVHRKSWLTKILGEQQTLF